MDLRDAASYHQLALRAEGRSDATLRIYLLYQRRFLEYLASRGMAPELDALNPINARQAVLWFQQRHVGSRGGEVATKMLLNVLKTWASFLEAEGVWANSPLRNVRRVKVRERERQPFSRSEVNAMLEACNSSRMPERDRLLVLLLLDTGARISEITGLRLGDIHPDSRTAHVLGKGNRERTAYFGDPAVADGGPPLRAYRAWLKRREVYVKRASERAGDRLLLTAAGYPLAPTGGTEAIKRIGKSAGVSRATPHIFRHTFATVFLTRWPGDEVGLRRIMGHISNSSMSAYVHLAQLEIARRAGKAAPTSSWLKEREA